MGRIPEASTKVVNEKQQVTPEWRNYWRRVEADVAAALQALTGQTSTTPTTDDDTDNTVQLASKSQVWVEAAYIELPEDKDYPFIALNYTGTITSVVTEAQSGSCTVQVLIGATALGGGTNSASTTRDTVAHSSSNDLADGDDVTIRISSNSDCEGLSVTLKGTQTLA